MLHRRAAILGVLAASLTLTSSAGAALDEVNTKKLREGVTVNGILQHERALQQIANANGGTRASGTAGYEASVAYVTDRLKKAGYKVSTQEFTFPFFRELAPATLQQVSPTPKTYETGTFDYSGTGTAEGNLQEVDVKFPPPAEPGSTSGCEDADFANFVDGNIALIQRGTCTFGEKVANAEEAGASGVIIFNEGQPGRQELFTGTLGGEAHVPVVGLSFADAQALHQQLAGGPVRMKITTSTENIPNAKTRNVIADTKQGDSSQVVVVGAHLDSVAAGPGINDNGSGTSGILEIAETMAEQKVKPRRQVRFAFWGAEEAGLLGSEHYVEELGTGVTNIYANLNFDMIGSPNYVRFVYDGDLSDTESDVTPPPGSAQIEALFNQYFAGQGLATDPTAFDGRSDYGPFIAAGVPAGGLFTGAEGEKTAEQAATYGGTAGEPYDACYHAACDTIGNLSTAALNEMSDGAAHATLTLAKSKSGFFEDGSRVGKKKKNGEKFQPLGHEHR